jgi:hypothetical protein
VNPILRVVASYESKILTRLGDSLRDEENLFYFVTISIEVPTQIIKWKTATHFIIICSLISPTEYNKGKLIYLFTFIVIYELLES